MNWVPLHVHSQYSILDSTASVEAIAEKAVEFKMQAVALTDQGNMYGAVEFFKACKSAGVKPIVGCELFVAPQSRHDKKRIPGIPAGFPIVLLAKNRLGYQNLCVLSSLAHLEGFYWTPRIDKELLTKHSEGLICLSGPDKSSLAHFITTSKEDELQAEIDWYKSVFKENYYFELLRHQMSDEAIRADGMDQESWLHKQYLDAIKAQEMVNARLISISREKGIRCVAANDSRYIDRQDWNAHEILMNVQSGEPCEIWEKDSYGNLKVRVKNPKRQVTHTHEMYFKSQQEMQSSFADFPEALQTTIEIAEQCQFEFDFKTKYYPVFVPPHLENKEFTTQERLAEAQKYLRLLCADGIGVRYTPERLAKVKEMYPGKDPMDVIKERLEYELDVILPKGMGDYLLIVWDFINWAKRSGIPMGPGRGSGAGSIVLYLIGITDIEPLRFNLFFERFINPERLSYPDIDVDICMDRRVEVIDYTVKKYGRDKVAQIITFGTMKAKMAIKDVGRVLSIPLARVNEIAKLVPEDPNMTLDKALEIDPELKRLYNEDAEVRRFLDIAKKLEGSVRNRGIHAAGMIISGDPIIERCPVCTVTDSEMVTQYSMKPVESVGMLKIDFLGLKTLTSIQHAVVAIKRRRGKEIDWINLPLDDKPTFDLLNQGKTMGIFQLESGGMQDLAKQLHIDKFEEIIAVGALYRPGPMEMIPSFINRKHKREVIEIDHPLMHDILDETYGIMVYQEQVMAIASCLAGYTLGEGDVLRRAMGKKDKEEMARQREKFRLGALAKGISEVNSMAIFDKIEKFASYGFNKSHAAAYGYLSYVTAYLKANYPSEWLAALMTSDRDDLSKVTKHIHEAKMFGIAILPPDVNESENEFVATSAGIRFAMGGIKGVGEGVVEAILNEREKKGPYTSLYDFVHRIDTRKVGKKVIENLIEAGCFDFTKWCRQAMLMSIDAMYEEAVREQKDSVKGVMNLFSLIEGEKGGSRFTTPPVVKEKIPRQKTLKREHELLGIYLNGHPLDDFRSQLQRLSCVPLKDIDLLPTNSVCRIAFIIEGLVVKISQKSQRKFAILTVGDGLERFELPVWPDLYEEKGALMLENQLLYAVVQKENQGGQTKLQCRWLDDLTKADESMIQVCDNAYDMAKQQVKKTEFREKSRLEKPVVLKEGKVKKNSFDKLIIQIDADLVRLSHILALKETFRAHSGEVPVEISFTTAKGKISSLFIDKSWGVDGSKELGTRVSSLLSVKSMAWE